MYNCTELERLSTNRNASNGLDSQTDVASYVLSLIMFTFAVYFFVVLVLFVSMNGFEENTKIKRQFTPQIFRRKRSPIDASAQHTRQLFRTLMFSVCLCVALLLVVQFSLQQPVIFGAVVDPKPFKLALKYTYGLQIVLGYVFMWIRQRLFYYGSSPLRKLLRRKSFLTAISSASLLFVMVNVIVQLSLAYFWNECTVLFEAAVWLGLCILVQGTLIGLFLYPLWTINRERKKILQSTNGRVFTSTSVNALIRRCLIFTSIYFVTDLAITLAIVIIELTGSEPIPELMLMLLQNFNSISNIACLVCSFQNWMTILAPWRKINKLRKQAAFFKSHRRQLT